MSDGSLAITHWSAPVLQVSPCSTRAAMSYTGTGKDLHSAILEEYRGPNAAKRLARDAGCRERAAKMALSGQYPKAWERFLALIAKRPAILARALKTDWATELAVKSEIAAT